MADEWGWDAKTRLLHKWAVCEKSQFFLRIWHPWLEVTPLNFSSLAQGSKNSPEDEIANVNVLRQHRTCRPRGQRLRPLNDFLISTKRLRLPAYPSNRVLTWTHSSVQPVAQHNGRAHCYKCDRGFLRSGGMVCGESVWVSDAGVDIVGWVVAHCGCAMLTVRALFVCVSIATRAYGLIVTGCNVGGVSLITELVLWLACSTSNIGESWGISIRGELPSCLFLRSTFGHTPNNGRQISMRHGCHLWWTGRDCSRSVS